jgi:hypothetical protein
VTEYQIELVRDVEADIYLNKGTVLATARKPVDGSIETLFGKIPLTAVILRGYNVTNGVETCVGQAG